MVKRTAKKIPTKAKKKVGRLNKNLIPPSKLPKNIVATIRLNNIVKEHLLAEGMTIQELFDSAIDKKLSYLEFEKTTTIKTNNKKS